MVRRQTARRLRPGFWMAAVTLGLGCVAQAAFSQDAMYGPVDPMGMPYAGAGATPYGQYPYASPDAMMGGQYPYGAEPCYDVPRTFSLNDAAGAFIDSALVGTQVRFRFDALYEMTHPDLAEFYMARPRAFRQAPDPLNDPEAEGLPFPETQLDFQEVSAYVEFSPWWGGMSIFAEVPFRFLNPEINDTNKGVGDVGVGGKYAVICEPDHYVTLFARLNVPSGDSEKGLGTNRFSVDQGILIWRQLTERLSLQAEVRDWQGLDDSDLEGNVLRYGLGLGYDVVCQPACNPCDHGLRITPVAEFVGWTVLDGIATVPGHLALEDAKGDTIGTINVGSRVTWGCHSFYGGWSYTLTHQDWYSNMLRFEYRAVSF